MNVNQATLINNYTRFIQTTQQQHTEIILMNNSFQRVYRQLIDLNYTDNEIFLQQRINELRRQRQQLHLNRLHSIANENRDIITSYSDLRPVEIYPSPEQINNATRILRYTDISGPTNTQCPIRSETFNNDDIVMQINHCNHVFYPSELYNWFRSHTRCPLCRFDIRDDISNANTTNDYVSNNRDISNSTTINIENDNELNNLSSNITRQIISGLRNAQSSLTDINTDVSVSWAILPNRDYRTIHRSTNLNDQEEDDEEETDNSGGIIV